MLPTTRLLAAEAGLHKMYDVRKAAGYDTAEIEKAFNELTAEMRARNLIYEPLDKADGFYAGKPKSGKGGGSNEGHRTATKGDPGGAEDEEGEDVPAKGAGVKSGKGGNANEGHRKLGKAAKIAAKKPAADDANDDDEDDRGKPPWLNKSALDPETGMFKRDFPAAERKRLAGSGKAMDDGSFPIVTEEDLHNAVRLAGNASDPGAAKKHIQSRAAAMGHADALPDDWQDKPKPKQKFAKLLGEIAEALGVKKEEAVEEADDLGYAVLKSANEDQFTLGPIYLPSTLDAHGEWATADDLRKSVWDYVRYNKTRDVYFQHSDKRAGEWVEVVSWPQEISITMQKSVDGVAKSETTTFPEGTPYLGVLWEDWAWDDVKKGKITGFSMGGSAPRLEAEVE